MHVAVRAIRARGNSFYVMNKIMALAEILRKFSNNGTQKVFVDTFDSPIGKVVAVADEDFLYILSFVDSKNIEKMFQIIAKELFCKFIEGQNKMLKKIWCEIQDYFDGKLARFTVPIKFFGSEFQKEVWNKLLEIPYGSTLTYGTLAKEMGRPTSHSRAVGAACGANSLIIVIPCHRLIGSSSKGGFSSGIDRKDWLIIHEKKNSK
ncbi:unnamed protein product, partial [Brenthis ino]